MEVYDTWVHAGVVVEIVHDENPTSPQENDNAGTLYSWTQDFMGDEQIREPDRVICVDDTEGEDGYREDVSLPTWFAYHYEATLTIPLWYDEGRGGLARIYESDDANCALVFTQEEIDKEWDGHLDSHSVEMKNVDGSLSGEVREYGGARGYAKARIKELDNWLQGNVWGVVIREPSDEVEGEGTGFVLDSVWGFIGEADSEWIREEANWIAESIAEDLKEEADEVAYWAARGVVTV